MVTFSDFFSEWGGGLMKALMSLNLYSATWSWYNYNRSKICWAPDKHCYKFATPFCSLSANNFLQRCLAGSWQLSVDGELQLQWPSKSRDTTPLMSWTLSV